MIEKLFKLTDIVLSEIGKMIKEYEIIWIIEEVLLTWVFKYNIILIGKLNNGDGVHLNCLMLMTPTGMLYLCL